MNDQVQGFGAQMEAGQPSEQLPVEQVPETQQPVTMDLLRQLMAEQTQQLERRLQSLSDKQENRLKKEVDKKVAALEENYRALGLQVPDAARQRVIDETVLSYLDNDAEAAQPAAPSPELVAYVNQRAQKIAIRAGVTLTPSDPEFSQVNQATPDPDTYLESWERAVTSKANRLKGVPVEPPPTQTQQPAIPPTNPAARVPMAGSGTPASSDNYQKYLAEVAKAPAGDAINIRRKWRSILRNEGIDL